MHNPRFFPLRSLALAAFAACLLAATAPAGAQGAPPATSPGPMGVTPASGSSGTPGKAGTVWGGIGIYHTGISVDYGFGTVSAGSTDIGLNAGAGYAIKYNDTLSIMPFVNAAMVFIGGGPFLPLTAGCGARFEKLGPIKLLAGLGLTLMPELGGGFGNGTPVGVALVGQGFYPLPNVPGLAVEAQLAVHILTNSTTEWTLNGGVAFDLF